MRNRKYYIALDEGERRIILIALNMLRNKLLAEGRYTDAVDPEYLDGKYWAEQGWLAGSRPWK